MEQIFKKFLQEHGVYETFVKFVLQHYRCSLQHYCKEHRIREYCLDLNRSPLFTGSEVLALNKKWIQVWVEEKKTLLYKFITLEGILFQFIEALPRKTTLETLCDDTHNINNVFMVLKQNTDCDIPWNKMNKKWRRYLKEKAFHYN